MFRIFFRIFISGCLFCSACESINKGSSKAKSVSKPNQEIQIAPETIFLSNLTEILQNIRALDQEIDITTADGAMDYESFSSLFTTFVYPRLVSLIKMANKLHPVTPTQVAVHQNILTYLNHRKTAAIVVGESSSEDHNWLKIFDAHLDDAEEIAQLLRENIAEVRKENANRKN